MVNRAPIKALAFDVFGTVVDWRSGIARDAAPVLARLDRSDIDPHVFADGWRKRYQPALEEVRSGRRPFVILDTLHREALGIFSAITASIQRRSMTPRSTT